MAGHGDLAGLVGPVLLRGHGLATRGDPGRGWIRRFTFFAGERVEGLEVRSPFRGIPPRRNRAAHRAASAASPRARGRPIRASSPARTDRRTGRRVVRGPRWACSSPPYGFASAGPSGSRPATGNTTSASRRRSRTSCPPRSSAIARRACAISSGRPDHRRARRRCWDAPPPPGTHSAATVVSGITGLQDQAENQARRCQR